MGKQNSKVDSYLVDGCGRCSLAATPQCKVNRWGKELKRLRKLLLDCQLTEDLKWGVPCYTFEKSNVVLLSAFKEYCALAFFKGALLKDAQSILVSPGENSQATRQIRFTHTKEIKDLEPVIRTYVQEAIDIEKAGLKIDFKAKAELVFSDELKEIFAHNPAFKAAFNKLTPGRQRAYNLYFSAPKQSQTRTSRVEKYMKHILAGKGLND